jgi:hypothetical protein
LGWFLFRILAGIAAFPGFLSRLVAAVSLSTHGWSAGLFVERCIVCYDVNRNGQKWMQVSGVPVGKPQQRKDLLRGSIFLPVRGSDVDKIRWKKGRKKEISIHLPSSCHFFISYC